VCCCGFGNTIARAVTIACCCNAECGLRRDRPTRRRRRHTLLPFPARGEGNVTACNDLIGQGPRARQKLRRVAIRGNSGLRPATSIGKAGTGSDTATHTAPMSLARRHKSPGEFRIPSASDGASLQRASSLALLDRSADRLARPTEAAKAPLRR
jgi:hypothetical protein